MKFTGSSKELVLAIFMIIKRGSCKTYGARAPWGFCNYLKGIFFILPLFFFPRAAFAGAAPEIYTPSEKNRLSSARSIDDRIRVYDTAFQRIRKEIENDIREDRFEDAARTLSRWSALLSESLTDIEANSIPNRRSNRLRQYEINLRQAINGMRSLSMRAPMDLYDALDSFSEQAEETRRKFINILFDHE
jgi:hypothetical protein